MLHSVLNIQSGDVEIPDDARCLSSRAAGSVLFEPARAPLLAPIGWRADAERVGKCGLTLGGKVFSVPPTERHFFPGASCGFYPSHNLFDGGHYDFGELQNSDGVGADCCSGAQMTHRVLVCGGRDFRDWNRLLTVLDHYHAINPFSLIIHGAARGADHMAGEWAVTRFVPVEEYPANWDRDGRTAGPIRNGQMLREGKPTVVIAFPGGSGTAHMKHIAASAGIPVLEIPA